MTKKDVAELKEKIFGTIKYHTAPGYWELGLLDDDQNYWI